MALADVPLEERGNTPEIRVLLAALHLDRSRLDKSGIERLTDIQWDELITIAGYQRVRPLLHERLFQTGRWQLAPERSWNRLVDECRTIAMQKIRMHAELSTILTSLSRAGIATIVLKGAHLGPLIYNNIALREMNDLDIMVRRDQLADAVGRVMAAGYRGLYEISVDADVRLSHHVTRLINGVTGLELHWNICPPHGPTTIDPEVLWQRARPVRLDRVETLVLPAEDLVLHLCFHASFHHGFEFGLRPAVDLAHAIGTSQPSVDWDAAIRTAEERHWSRGVAVALQLARELAGADVPEDVIRRMAPTGIDPAVAQARQLTWLTPAEIRRFAVGLSPLGDGESLGRSFRAAFRQVFLPRKELTALYHVQEDTWWWPALVASRTGDLLWRHGAMSLRLLAGRDRKLRDLARRRSRVRAWLS